MPHSPALRPRHSREYRFLPPKKIFFKISRPSKKNLKPDHTELTLTDITRNVWKHELSECKLLLASHHLTRKPAGNSVQARCFILGGQKVNYRITSLNLPARKILQYTFR